MGNRMNAGRTPHARRHVGMKLHARRILAYTVLTILSVLCLCWFYVLFINATRSDGELQRGFTLVPSTHFGENWYHLMTGTLPVVRGMLNSVFVAGMCAVLSTYFCAMTAYAIHAYEFKLKKFAFTFILVVMTIPVQATTLGFVQMVFKLRLDNSFLPLILPSIATPVTFFYLKQFMDSNLSLSLVEAARIDGSGEFRTFNRIVIPLVKPAMATQAIFNFVTSWNNYFVPALLLDDEEKKTLPILIAQLRSADFLKFDMGQVYIMIAFSIFPVIVIYLFLSRFIVQGIVVGGIKG